MEPIEILLDMLKQGGKQSHLNLTLFPLLATDAGDPDYIVLEEALAKSSVEISEVSEGGRVPELKMINKSADKILNPISPPSLRGRIEVGGNWSAPSRTR